MDDRPPAPPYDVAPGRQPWPAAPPGPPASPPPAPAAPKPRRTRIVLAVLGVLVLLVAVTAATGGLRAQPHGPKRTVAGHTVNQGLFDVQIMDARAGQIKLAEFSPAANLLIVRMKVTNLGDKSYGISSFVEGVPAEPKHGRFAEADLMGSRAQIEGQPTTELHPRLPAVVEAVWRLGNAPAPSTVTVALRSWEYGQGFTSDEFYWSVTKESPLTAEVTVPVRPGATT
jgi:hypothetical protein